MARPTNCPVYAGYCSEHGFTHGAEELREGVERLIEEYWNPNDNNDDCDALRADLQRLLDEVDARDSLAFSECPKKRRRACTAKAKTAPTGSEGT